MIQKNMENPKTRETEEVIEVILEELIHKRFIGSEKLVQHLALFNGAPAVFSPEPPDESQEGAGIRNTRR